MTVIVFYIGGDATATEQKNAELNFNKPYGITDGVYTIKSVNSGLVLDVPGESTELRKQIQQWTPNGTVAQQFFIKGLGDGVYTMQNIGNGLYLDIKSHSLENKAPLIQFTLNDAFGTKNQQFRFVEAGNDAYWIFCTESGKCLDVEGVSKEKGAKLIQYQPNWFLSLVYDKTDRNELFQSCINVMYYYV